MMKKINNKGYMIVEIIVASVLAMTIAYFLFDLVVKLKEKYDYVQTDTVLTTEKTVITNEILGDLYTRDIIGVTVNGKQMTYTLSNNTSLILKYNDEKIVYQEGDNIIYQKKLNEKLQVSEPEVKCENNVASFIIKASTITSKKNYNINIILPVAKCN